MKITNNTEAGMVNFKQTRRGFQYNFVTEQAVGGDPNKLRVARLEVSYLNGSQRKGVLATLRTIELEQHDGYVAECFEMFAGVSVWAKLLPRKNDKQVALVAEQLDAYAPDIVSEFIDNPEQGKIELQHAITEAVK
jgi:hypothetical protein